MTTIPELVDRERAAVLLGGVSTKTVDRLRARGEIATVAISTGCIRITTDSIAEYVERQLASEAQVCDERPSDFPIPALEAIKREKAAARAQSTLAEGA